MKTIKLKIIFLFTSIIAVFVVLLNYLNTALFPVFLKYGEYECNNLVTKLVNHVVLENITEDLKQEIIIYEKNDVVTIDFNTSILNSIASSSVKKMQSYFYKLEHGILDEEICKIIGLNIDDDKKKQGIIYEVPFYRAIGNSLIGNIGINIPVRYKIIGDIKGQITSTVKEYGINNTLLEINLEISSKCMVTIPMMSNESEVKILVPLVMKIIQGEIPDMILGTNVIGGI